MKNDKKDFLKNRVKDFNIEPLWYGRNRIKEVEREDPNFLDPEEEEEDDLS